MKYPPPPRMIFLYLFVITLFLFSACDLFNPTDPDMLAKIDAEIAWANAAPISVTIVFPEAWGFSPQRGTGRCLDDVRNVAPRVGYSFTVQFDPSPAYGDAEWEAYKTSDLPPGNEWFINAAAIDNATKDLKELGSDEISITQIDGGKSSVVIYIKDAVTLIPKSELQPRIIFSDPPRGSIIERTPNNQITITFATAVDSGTLIYKKNHIEITGGSTGSDIEPMESYFALPSYDEENHRLTINSKGAIPAEYTIEVKLGYGIKSPGGEKGLKETVLSYRTVLDLIAINSWMALYNEENERIEVYWKMPEGVLNAAYQMNNGSFHSLQWEKGSDDVIRSSINAARPNDRSVRDGIAPIGFNRYTIILSFNDEQTQINIWNVPGMEVRQNWNELPDITLTEIFSSDELNELRNSVNSVNNFSQNKIFVLRRNITLENWIPIGTATAGRQFLGEFYGNGHTVTINSFVNSTEITDYGLFGVVRGSTEKDALVRDLTVLYNNVNVNFNATRLIYEYDNDPDESGALFGGLTTEVMNTQFENVLVKGTVNISGTVLQDSLFIGGLSGWIHRDSTMKNAYGGLNIYFTANAWIILIGGIGGKIGNWEDDWNTLDKTNVNIEEVTVTGDIVLLCNSVSSDNFIDVGGLVGRNYNGSIKNSGYREGSFTIQVGAGTARIGGAIGINDGFVYSCYALQKNFEFTKTGGGDAFVGGFVGRSGNLIEHCYSENQVDLNIDTSDTVSVRAGGFAGFSYDARYCYAKGNVSAMSTRVIHLGGFAGAAEGNIRFCYATGNVSGFVSGGNHSNIGGFVGWSTANISDCYAVGNVFVDKESGIYGNISVGGFAGLQETNNITNCFAGGTVVAHRREIINPGSVLFSTGGFAGHIGYNQNTASINKSAALGQSVTATGALVRDTTTFHRDAGRFFGGVSTNGSAGGNYVIDTMQLYESDEYKPAISITPVVPSSNDATSKHGANLSFSTTLSPNFWLQILNFNNVSDGPGGFQNTWNFAGIEGRGYPLLNDANGNLMGGQ